MQYVDYELGTDLDLEFTDWGDLATIEDGDVILQNAVIRSFDIIDDHKGGPFQQEDAARLEGEIQRQLNRMDDVRARRVRVTAVNEADGSLELRVDVEQPADAAFDLTV